MASEEPGREVAKEKERCFLYLILCHSSGLSAQALSRRLKLPVRLLLRFQSCEEAPPWGVIYGIVATEDLPLFFVPEMYWRTHFMRRPPAEPDYQDEKELRRTGTDLVARLSGVVDFRLAGAPRVPVPCDPSLAAAAAGERRQAEELWLSLRDRSTLEWRNLPGDRQDLRTWALVERLCHESARRAAHDEGEAPSGVRFWAAEGLAELALRIACTLPPLPWDPEWHKVREYAWAHVGNVRRAAGDLAGADEAFYYADEHFQYMQGPSLLDSARPFLLKAMLRRTQGRPGEALTLLQRAELLAAPDDVALAVTLAEVQLRQGDAEGAAAPLEQALAALAGSRRAEPWWAARALRLAFELAARRVGEGRAAEGAGVLERAAPLAEAARSRPGVAALASAFVKLAAKGRLDAARAEALWNDFCALTGPRSPGAADGAAES